MDSPVSDDARWRLLAILTTSCGAAPLACWVSRPCHRAGSRRARPRFLISETRTGVGYGITDAGTGAGASGFCLGSRERRGVGGVRSREPWLLRASEAPPLPN